MRLAFLGTPASAVVCLRALCEAGHDVALVITRPDRRRGRGSTLVASPVSQAATELGVPVRHELASLEDFDVDLGVVVAYGALIPARVLERIPMLNVHFSLLPRWRGAAPVARAILAGDEETGVDIMGLEEGLDTGPIYAEARVRIADQTLEELTGELADEGARLLCEVLSKPEGLPTPRAQEGETSYASKLEPRDFVIEPEQTVLAASRVVRLERSRVRVGSRALRVVRARPATSGGAPGTLTHTSGAVLLNVGDGALLLERVQPESSREMSAESWWSGARLEDPVPWESLVSGADR